MGEWIDFDRWPECASMERPGIVFEVQNAEGQTMATGCVAPLPLPFDWTSDPVRFRIVEQEKPRHSEPLPQPGSPQ
ncbi:hypothetical protein [Chelativorans alearense]|uniref:hypothetical protein n=1 Tax=Chelativorans alearense TaxID=2681495 RepID=UPI0013D63BC4|nr:hypothetical protein [Chelativorans alearense]